MSHIAENLEVVKGRVAEAAARSGRKVDLLVVSKTWPVEVVSEAVDAGQVLFGENRLQEGEEKIPNLPVDLEWHFIGGLQRNKIRKVLPLFPVILSLALEMCGGCVSFFVALSGSPLAYMEKCTCVGARPSSVGLVGC